MFSAKGCEQPPLRRVNPCLRMGRALGRVCWAILFWLVFASLFFLSPFSLSSSSPWLLLFSFIPIINLFLSQPMGFFFPPDLVPIPAGRVVDGTWHSGAAGPKSQHCFSLQVHPSLYLMVTRWSLHWYFKWAHSLVSDLCVNLCGP